MSKWSQAIALVLAVVLLALCAGCAQADGAGTGAESQTGAAVTPRDATGEEEPASAARYPNGPVKIIVPMAAGGSTDTAARTIQPYLSRYLDGNPVIVENVEGAGGKIGVSQVYKAVPDGQELLLGVFPAWLMNEALDADADYVISEMVPIYNVSGNDFNALAVPYDSPIQNIEEFLAASREGKLNVAGSGLGTNSYLSFVLLKDELGADVEYIPYSGGNDAAMAVAGGHVDAAVGSVIAFRPLEDEGQVRVIAGFGHQRAQNFPDVPTLVESGYPGAHFDIILGLMAPPGTPDEVVRILEEAMAQVVADPEFLEMAERANITIAPMDAAAYGAAIRESRQVVEDNLESLLAGQE